MNEKTCTKCNQTFPATKEYFVSQKRGKYGLTASCKKCRRSSSSKYHAENKAKCNERSRQYHLANKDEILERKRQYYQDNRNTELERKRQWRLKNPMYGARYYQENKEDISARQHQYYKDNKEEIDERNRQYRQAHKKELRKRARKYYHENKEAYAERDRRYREENKEAISERQRQYRQENKERIAEWCRQWRKDNPEKVRAADNRRRARINALPATFTADEWDYCLEYFNYTCPVCDNQLRDLFGNVEPHADHWIPISYEGDDNPGTVAANMVCLCNSCNLSKGSKMPDEWLKETYSTRKSNEILARIEAYFDHLDDLQQSA